MPAPAAQAKEIASKFCDAARRARPFPRTWRRPEAPTRAIAPSLTMRKPVQSVRRIANSGGHPADRKKCGRSWRGRVGSARQLSSASTSVSSRTRPAVSLRQHGTYVPNKGPSCPLLIQMAALLATAIGGPRAWLARLLIGADPAGNRTRVAARFYMAPRRFQSRMLAQPHNPPGARSPRARRLTRQPRLQRCYFWNSANGHQRPTSASSGARVTQAPFPRVQ